MQDYLSVNRDTYDALVDQYASRMDSDIPGDTMLMALFFRLLWEQFKIKRGLRLLDVGCGNGLNLRMMLEHGHFPTGIDLSPKMADLAKRTAPEANVIVGDFLAQHFPVAHFHGVFAKAIIHLFPKDKVGDFLSLVRHILVPGGVFYVTTTAEEVAREGFAEKIDYVGKPFRYRSRWTTVELKSALIAHGFRINWESFDREHSRNKTWVNFWATSAER